MNRYPLAIVNNLNESQMDNLHFFYFALLIVYRCQKVYYVFYVISILLNANVPALNESPDSSRIFFASVLIHVSVGSKGFNSNRVCVY